MERAALNLLVEIAPQQGAVVCSLRGTPPPTPGVETLTGVRALARAANLVLRRRGTLTVCGLWAAVTVAPFALVGRGRWIVWEHSLLESRLRHDGRIRALFRFARPVYRRASVVVCVSNAVREAVGPVRMARVIPNIIQEADSPMSRPGGTATDLVSLGALRRAKNYEMLLEAMTLLPDRHLTIYGEGPDRLRLERLAELLGVSPRVRFMGYKTDARSLIAGATALVHPSLYETFGMALIEAGVVDVPVVALSAAAMDESVPRWAAGVLVEPSAEGLARGITKVSDHKALNEQLTAARMNRQAELCAAAVGAGWRQMLAWSEGRRYEG